MREATIHIPNGAFESVGLGDFVRVVRGAGLRDITELACQSEGCIVVLTVENQIAAESLDSVARLQWWERLVAEGDHEIYLCKIDFPSFDDDINPLYTSAVSTEEMAVNDDGIDIRIVGSQAEIADEIDEYDAAGMTVLLERISDYSGPKDTLDSLTDRQREILETAYDLGYFDVPRNVATADVAAELELDASTVAEHLQRAERNLVATLLATP